MSRTFIEVAGRVKEGGTLHQSYPTTSRKKARLLWIRDAKKRGLRLIGKLHFKSYQTPTFQRAIRGGGVYTCIWCGREGDKTWMDEHFRTAHKDKGSANAKTRATWFKIARKEGYYSAGEMSDIETFISGPHRFAGMGDICTRCGKVSDSWVHSRRAGEMGRVRTVKLVIK